MPLLAPPAARYFCKSFPKLNAVSPNQSFRQLANTWGSGTLFTEGTAPYGIFRDLALREIERLLVLSASNYRRSLDLMMPGASHWAYVTMYYGTFFAASALLGMFGMWKLKRRSVSVSQATVGSLQFQVNNVTSPTPGSHQQFWDLFYANTPQLAPWVDPTLIFAISPVSGQLHWLADNRNDINYDTYSAITLAENFRNSFKSSEFPSSLPGAMNTQFRVLEGLLLIASGFARDFGLETDATLWVDASTKRRGRAATLVTHAVRPKLEHRFRRLAT